MNNNKNKCELCSMDATQVKNTNGVGHYFCDHHAPSDAVKVMVTPSSTFKKLIPLLSIFALIGFLAFETLILKNDFSFHFSMSLFMGYFFIVFGLFKVVNLKVFADAYVTYDVLAKRSYTYALAYPFIELVLGVMYLVNWGGVYRDGFTFLIMAISAYGVYLALKRKEEIPCACLGMIFEVPMTKVTLFENIIMALMALWMVSMAL